MSSLMINVYKYGNTAENNSWVFPGGVITADVEAGDLRLHDGVSPGGWKIEGSPVEIPLPGPQALQAGDTTAGFYGDVSSSAIIDGPALAAAIGLSAGDSINPDAGWLKFAHNGKTLFIAKKPLRYGASWSKIYECGAVWGDGTTGPRTYAYFSEITQNATVTIDGHEYRVRLMSGADIDPAGSADAGGEWNALIYNVHVDDLNGASWGIGYTNDDLHLGDSRSLAEWTYCKESSSSAPDARMIARGDATVEGFSWTTMVNGNNILGWRPVLEPIG